jgi:histidine kinase
LDTIQNEMMIANGVADLLLRKLRRLPQYSLELLKVASLLGYMFSDDTLLDVVRGVGSLSGEEVDESSASGATRSVAIFFREALKEGFLERTNAVREGSGEPKKRGYQFSHDKVQSSLQSMITYEEVCRLHLFIGEMYLARQDREYVYPAAIHLNRAPTFWQDQVQRIELVKLNLEASTICREKAAFAESAAFLRRGLALLDKDTMWDDMFDLAFKLTESLAKMELIIGNLEDCKRMTTVVLERGKTVEMKCNSLIIDVEARMAGVEMDETISAANRALNVLGVKLPAKVGFQHVLLKVWKVKRLLRNKTDEDILGLPVMSDRIKATTIKLLINLALYCLLKDDLERGVVSALLALQLTLKGGLSPYSANALTIYGVAEVTLGNQKSGYRFGKLALRMLDHVKYKETESATIGMALASLIHWREPIRALQKPFQGAMDIGFDVGDVVFGSFCAANCFATRVVLGEELQSLERFMCTCYSHISDLSQDALTLWVQPGLQFVLNLQTINPTRWADLITLTGEIMDENEYYHEVDTTKNKALHTMVRLYKSMLAFNFGYYDLASAIFGEMADGSKAFKDTFGVLPLYFYGALTSYSLFCENGKRKEQRLARKNLHGLQRMKAAGNPNTVPFLALLEAEELSLRKRADAVTLVAAYSKAISSSALEGYTHMEALANERAVSALSLMVSRAESEKYFDRAMLLYSRWGATAKHEWLEEKKWKYISECAEDPTRPQESLVGGVISIGTRKTQAVSS